MALTLTEAAKLATDVMRAGVIETTVKESPVLQFLPFVDVVGNSLLYTRENVAPTASWFAVGDTWTEGVSTFTQVSANLKILGGDADVDRYISQTRSNVQDIEAAVIELKAKAVARQLEDTFLYGDAAANANEFTGLHKTVAAPQRVPMGSGAIPAALSLAKLDEMIDLVRPGKPDLLIMSRRTRRGLSAYARANQSPVTYSVDQFGQQVAFYNGIRIAVSDYLTDTETIASGTYSAKTGGSSSSIFAVKFGEDALVGIHNGGLTVESLGPLEQKDARRYRIRWYVNGCVLFATPAAAVIDGISAGAVVA